MTAPMASPRPVTRGESNPTQLAKVDWLNCTFAEPAMSPEGFVAMLGRLLGRPVSGVSDRGMLGFEKSIKLFARHGSLSSPIGSVAMGGESQRGRWLFQLTGAGCQFVKDWEGISDFLESLEAKLTRVDLCVDFLEGEHTVEEAVTLYQSGGFQLGGRSPSSRLDGDWLDGAAGRSLYVGKSKNGKMLRVYEKGRQLGDPTSDWTRFEVQLGSRDRGPLPYHILTNRDAFFAGCYPALASFVQEAAQSIPTLIKTGEVSIAHLLFHLKRCYGKVIGTLKELEASDADLIEEVTIVGVPRRVNLSSVAAGVTWDDVQFQHKRLTI